MQRRKKKHEAKKKWKKLCNTIDVVTNPIHLAGKLHYGKNPKWLAEMRSNRYECCQPRCKSIRMHTMCIISHAFRCFVKWIALNILCTTFGSRIFKKCQHSKCIETQMWRSTTSSLKWCRHHFRNSLLNNKSRTKQFPNANIVALYNFEFYGSHRTHFWQIRYTRARNVPMPFCLNCCRKSFRLVMRRTKMQIIHFT